MLEQDGVFGNANVFDEAPTPAAAGALGAPSPDGIGAYATPFPDQDSSGLGATWDFVEPEDVSPQSAMRSAGFTALFATVALGAGIAIGGPWGAGAGVLLAGSAVNGYRAQKWWGSADPSEKHEAVVSAVFAVFGVGVGGYMAYKAYSAKKGDS